MYKTEKSLLYKDTILTLFIFTGQETYKLSEANPCKAIVTHIAICLIKSKRQQAVLKY